MGEIVCLECSLIHPSIAMLCLLPLLLGGCRIILRHTICRGVVTESRIFEHIDDNLLRVQQPEQLRTDLVVNFTDHGSRGAYYRPCQVVQRVFRGRTSVTSGRRFERATYRRVGETIKHFSSRRFGNAEERTKAILVSVLLEVAEVVVWLESRLSTAR
jgi:hypothetical protein